MTRKSLPVLICFTLFFSLLYPPNATAETIEEFQERIKREQEEEAKKRKKTEGTESGKSDASCCFNFIGAVLSSSGDDDDDRREDLDRDDEYRDSSPTADGENGCCLDVFSAGIFGAIGGIRYADYPFAPNSSFDFAAVTPEKKPDDAAAAAEANDKFWMAELSVDGSYLFGQEISYFALQGLGNLEFSIFHVNLLFQHIMDAAGSFMDLFSANAGVSLPLFNFVISLYGGAFWLQGFPVYVSFGASAKLFIPDRVIISLYTLFCYYDPFFFMVISPTVELAIGRFTVGLGFNYYNYAGLALYGPTLKTAVWF